MSASFKFKKKSFIKILVLLLLLIVVVHFPFGEKPALAAFTSSPLPLADNCSVSGLTFCDIVAGTGQVIVRVTAFFMWLGAVLLNYTVNYTITNIKSSLQSVTAIPIAWTAFRDLSNIFFVFILLYIAISTILQLEGVNTKKVLSSLIVVALLINFSLFFTEAIIDASNFLTVAFLNQIKVNGQSLSINNTNYSSVGLASAFASPLGLGSLFAPPSTDGTVNGFADPNNPGKNLTFTNEDFPQLFLLAFMSGVLMIVLAFVFAVSSLFFIYRFIVLIILLFLSPLAFAGMILPKTNAMISQKWWKSLFDQALFAPAYFALMWVIVQIFQSFTSNQQNWQLLFSGGSAGVALMFNFIIIIGLVISVLILSKSFGMYGAAGALSSLNGAKNSVVSAIGRNSVGRLGRGLGGVYDRVENAANENKYTRGLGTLLNVASLGGLGALNKGARNSLKRAEGIKAGSGLSLSETEKRNRDRAKELQQVNRASQQAQAMANLRSGNPTPGEIDVVSGMSSKELESHGASTLKHANVAPYLKSAHMESIQKSDSFTDEEKKLIAESRKTNTITTLANPSLPAGVKEKVVSNMSGKDLAKLGGPALTPLAPMLKASQLKEMEDLPQLDRVAIGDAIRNHAATHPTDPPQALGFVNNYGRNGGAWI